MYLPLSRINIYSINRASTRYYKIYLFIDVQQRQCPFRKHASYIGGLDSGQPIWDCFSHMELTSFWFSSPLNDRGETWKSTIQIGNIIKSIITSMKLYLQ